MSEFRLMLVEDSGIIVSDIDQILDDEDVVVSWQFTRAEEAIERIPDVDPDLVLMDIQLEGDINGIEATRKITTVSEVPVVFLTAYSNPDTLESAEDTDAIAFLIKPLEESDLRGIVKWIKSDSAEPAPKLSRGQILATQNNNYSM